MAKKRMQTIKVHDYGDEEVNRLAVAQSAFDKMTDEELLRALRWFKGKYPKAWPSDQY